MFSNSIKFPFLVHLSNVLVGGHCQASTSTIDTNTIPWSRGNNSFMVSIFNMTRLRIPRIKHHEVVPQPTILDLQFALICYDLLKSLEISKWHIHIAAAGHTCLSNLQLVRPIRHPDIPWNPPTCSAKTPAVQWKPAAKLTGQPTRLFRSQPTPRHSGQAKMRILGKPMVKLAPIWAQRSQATRAAFGVWKKIGGLMFDELTKHFSIRLQKIANPESITRIYKEEKQQSYENPKHQQFFSTATFRPTWQPWN